MITNNYKNPFDFFDYQKFLTTVKLPTAGNNEQAVASSKKALEAYSGASRAIYEGFNTFAKRQVEILNSAIANAKDATSELSTGNPKEAAVKSIELTKKSIDFTAASFGFPLESSEVASFAFAIAEFKISTCFLAKVLKPS